jgi:hypothetical protein
MPSILGQHTHDLTTDTSFLGIVAAEKDEWEQAMWLKCSLRTSGHSLRDKMKRLTVSWVPVADIRHVVQIALVCIFSKISRPFGLFLYFLNGCSIPRQAENCPYKNYRPV